ncbi:hypothetical protein QVD17_02811 [Tagetes erecta]|uniref:Uncharacterized protein n=1 Tax=Tagetes erecta TaxID=13708 RepID=A0AAD8P9H1_TARER|nr:hypothetical protein QVD17_02811 [Tagetes erecta]
MASKFGIAGGIPERRVRPLWDAIDSRQFKNALKLSTALLSKYVPQFFIRSQKIVKGLKALCYDSSSIS